MSYEIVYERQFLKTSDGLIIPLVLMGSNNCYEPLYKGRQRRYRSWTTLFVQENERIALRPVKLLQRAYSWTGGLYQQHFMRHGKWVNDKGLIRFCQNGIKKAKTIEEINQVNIFPLVLKGYFSVWYPNRSLLPDGSAFPENKLEDELHIRSSEDLELFLERAAARLQQRGKETIQICIHFPDEKVFTKKVWQ